jgi:DNA polymerase III epsilon subunit-like protein
MDWKRANKAVIDTETCGLDWTRDEICEIGVVFYDPDWKILGEFGTLVHTDRPIPGSATEIHGITNQMVEDAPYITDALKQMEASIESVTGWEGLVLAAYNAPYDHRMMGSAYLRALRDPPAVFQAPNDECRWIDVLQWARDIQPYQRGKGQYKLAATAARLGVELGTAHRATGDCQTTGRVLQKLIEVDWSGKNLLPDDLDELLMRQRISYHESKANFLSWLSKQPRMP